MSRGIDPQLAHGRTAPPEWLVHDEVGPCVYLPGQTACLPLRLPVRPLSRAELAQRLEAGDRRQGRLLYRPSCPACTACQPLRIDVAAFVPSKTQRRVWRHGSAELRTEIDVPRLSAEKVALYNRHKGERGLLVSEHVLDADGYRDFLVSSCAETIELRYRQGGRLVAVAIADVASNALSAVYCYFDPGYSRLSPGTYSILRLLELCRTWELQYLYLGLYVEGCATMAYKATYLPHERLIAGRWRRFEHPDGKVPTA